MCLFLRLLRRGRIADSLSNFAPSPRSPRIENAARVNIACNGEIELFSFRVFLLWLAICMRRIVLYCCYAPPHFCVLISFVLFFLRGLYRANLKIFIRLSRDDDKTARPSEGPLCLAPHSSSRFLRVSAPIVRSIYLRVRTLMSAKGERLRRFPKD